MGHKKTIKQSRVENNILSRFTLILISICILYIFFSPQHGLLNLVIIHMRAEKLSAELYALESQNEEIKLEISKIQTDKNYLEKIARNKYGLLKENEIIYNIKM
ncbi:MAG: septum formation initiator family protein [Desulfobulbaceae bacterium]|nr:septum formation initiator family protein [Desulfobulbaceae bacterium]